MYYFSASGASGALAATLAPTGGDFAIHEIRLHLGGAGAAENLTATLDSNLGSLFDTVLLATTTSGVTDVVSVQDRYFRAGDEIDFALTNTNDVAWGLEVVFSLQ